jgi:tetratricopeptide (TPR) repeat protein
MRLIDALSNNPEVSVFAVLDSEADDTAEWDVEPVDGEVLRESEVDYYFVVKAKNILSDGTVRDCYIDVNLPERISDYAIFVVGDRLDARYRHEFDGEIICAVPIDCFGVYDLFYSKSAPEVGIEVLKRGLILAPRSPNIAQDLGYILRDEGRYEEAAAMFQVAVDEGPSSYFLYGELAACYDSIDQPDKARLYQDMFNKPTIPEKRGVLGGIYDWLRGKGGS